MRAWSVGVGVGLSSAGHHLWYHMEVFFPKISNSVLSELSLRQLSLIQLATVVTVSQKLVRVVEESSVSERTSCVVCVRNYVEALGSD